MATPIWLTDIDYPAPCNCGEPVFDDEPNAMIITDTGLKRLMHMRCIPPGMLD